jgi:hypothetical protein
MTHDWSTPIAIGLSVIALLLSLVSVVLTYRTARKVGENILQAKRRELPASANTAEPTASGTLDAGEADE